jgi:hypothetical protein
MLKNGSIVLNAAAEVSGWIEKRWAALPPASKRLQRGRGKRLTRRREDAKVIIFQKFRPDPSFLDCGGLTPLWIFPSERSTPSKAPSSRSTPRHPHCHKTSWVTAELYPPPSASPREIPVPCFLDCGGLTPLWIFPVAALDLIQSSVRSEHSKTPSWPQNVLGNCGTLSPTLRASASPREIPDPSFLDCGGLTPLWI